MVKYQKTDRQILFVGILSGESGQSNTNEYLYLFNNWFNRKNQIKNREKHVFTWVITRAICSTLHLSPIYFTTPALPTQSPLQRTSPDRHQNFADNKVIATRPSASLTITYYFLTIFLKAIFQKFAKRIFHKKLINLISDQISDLER